MHFLVWNYFLGFWVFANKPTMQNGGGSVAVAVGLNDRRLVAGDR